MSTPAAQMTQILYPVPDRRAATRSPDPCCSTCNAAAKVAALVRTSMAVYYRCDACGRIWGEPKPEASDLIRDALRLRH